MTRLPTWGEPAVGEVAWPRTCPTCGGEGEVIDPVTKTIPFWCPACRCVCCGVPCTTGMCPECDAADMYEQDLRRERGR